MCVLSSELSFPNRMMMLTRADIEHRKRMTQQLFENLMLKAAETRNPFKKLYYWYLAIRALRVLDNYNRVFNRTSR